MPVGAGDVLHYSSNSSSTPAQKMLPPRMEGRQVSVGDQSLLPPRLNFGNLKSTLLSYYTHVGQVPIKSSPPSRKQQHDRFNCCSYIHIAVVFAFLPETKKFSFVKQIRR